MNLSELAEKRQSVWMNLRALFEYEHMPEWSELKRKGLLSTRQPRIKFFISHPWESQSEPDPTGTQWRALQQIFLRSVNRGAVPGPFSYIQRLTPPSFDGGYALTLNLKIANESFLEQNQRKLTQPVYRVYRSIDEAFEGMIGPYITLHDDPSLQIWSSTFRKMGIWLDYCCLPQGTRSAEEQIYFERMLPQLTYLAAVSSVIAIWPDEAVQFKRAWCAAEVTINSATVGVGVARANPAVISQSLAKESEDARRPPLLIDMTNATVCAIEDLLKLAKVKDNSPDRIKKQMQNMGLQCTVESDLDVIANAVYAATVPLQQIGSGAIRLAALGTIMEALWWLLSLPLLLFYTLGSLAFFTFNKHTETPKWSSCLLALPFMMIFVCMLPLSMFLMLILSPLELVRRALESEVLKQRARHVVKADGAATTR